MAEENSAEEDAAAAVYIFSFHFVPSEREERRAVEPPEEFQQGASTTLPGSLF